MNTKRSCYMNARHISQVDNNNTRKHEKSIDNHSDPGPVGKFIEKHYKHFNAAILANAAKEWQKQLAIGNKMLIAMAGAMSTAEIGISLAEMIRRDKVHIICCTGANLEEDIFNLVAHDKYVAIPDWRNLTPQDELRLLKKGMNRVTDTCIPEEEALRKIEKLLLDQWKAADKAGQRFFPHEFIYKLIENGAIDKHITIDRTHSWVIAAYEKNLPIIVPGWEDSTLGNMYAAACFRQEIKNVNTVRSGIEYMIWLARYYEETSASSGIGFFQIGGGIAGDFPICVVPMLNQDLKKNVPLWSYFCQISDSTTSYGSYSGAIPNEKITWGKLDINTPKFIIESDATIVAPLIFAYVLGY